MLALPGQQLAEDFVVHRQQAAVAFVEQAAFLDLFAQLLPVALQGFAAGAGEVFEQALHAYLRDKNAELMERINKSGDYNDEIASGLREAIKAFKATSVW